VPFDRSAGWSVGVEEELMLVDEQTFDLVPAAAQVLAGLTGPEPQSPKQELLTSMLETTTGACASPEEAGERMRAERTKLRGLLAPHGLCLLAAGSHPFATPEDQPIADEPYYLDFARFAGPVARRQAVCGLHVHIGMPDGDTALRALEVVLPWLPVVLAVSANSPYFRGKETGLLSTRAEVLLTLPRSSAPPALRSFADWEALMERWQAAGAIQRFTNAWWDARINPDFGTLELRMPDQPTDVEVAVRIAAALHGLAVRAAAGELDSPAHRVDYSTNRFAAARFGPRAELIWGDRLVPAGELAGELGLDGECEADRQLGHDGDLRTLCADLVARS
jgi:glutamate---cysteine ligase / carboxylate-amine ligase